MNIDGIETAQTQAQIDLFDELVNRFNVRVIIELGLYRGGLANILIKKQSENLHYYGFEFVEKDLDSKVRNRPEITIGDVTNDAIFNQIQEIVNKSDGAILIFCDTFDKPREMLSYSRILRVGDLIQGHDYPGEGVDDVFLAKFADDHPDLVEIDSDRIRHQIGTTVWRKIR